MYNRPLSQLDYPFPLPKPRNSGLVMFTDLGCGVHEQDDIMRTSGQFADLAKLATSLCATLPTAILKEKIENYRKHGVETFPGGVQLEHVLYKQGKEKANYYFEEMQSLGLKIIEVSDNYINLSPKTKYELIQNATKQYGFKVLAEVGEEVEQSTTERLVEDCKNCIAAGSWKILLEAAEIMDKSTGLLKDDLIETIQKEVGLENIIFELPWVWLRNVHWHQTFSTLAILIEKFGSKVNIGNLEMSMLAYCETLRNGSGTKLPKDKII